METMELLERLESAWFFSNVLSTAEPPPKPAQEAPETPSKAQPEILTRRGVDGPDPVADLSRSPRRREEDERRRLRRRQRSYGGACRGNLEISGGGEFKDERAMKRQLKTWAVAVAVASAAQARPMVALCC